MNLSAANQLAIAESASQSITIATTTIAAAKNAEKQSKQIKIEFVLAKAQHILLNNASFEFDSQLDIQNQIQAI